MIMNKWKYIDWSIIAKSLREDLTSGEQQRLEEWLEASALHRQFYDRMIGGGPTNPEIGLTEKELKHRKDLLWEKLFHIRRRRSIYRWGGYAAVCLLMIGAVLFFKFAGQENAPASPVLTARLPALPPGNSKAVLKLEDGREIVLDSLTDKSIEYSGGVIRKQGQTLVYDSANSKDLHYNKLFIPRGGEYRLILADGTRVWINSCTELIFPVAFPENERVVEVNGEAYFEVAREQKRPFKVMVQGMQVRVYGTKFNVNSYEEGRVTTTLLEGKVGICRKDETKEKMLKPDEQAVFDNSSGEFRIRHIDAAEFIAWKNGEFVFNDESIEAIMKRLAVWYDIEVIYENESVRHKKFTGVLARYQTIDKILYYIAETATVSFSADGRNIIVK